MIRKVDYNGETERNREEGVIIYLQKLAQHLPRLYSHFPG